MRIEITRELTQEQKDRLWNWSDDIFGANHLQITWRPKEWHILVHDDEDLLMAKASALKHDVLAGGETITVGGIGGVLSLPEARGKGLAQAAMKRAESFMREDLHASFGFLFCFDRLLPFYNRLGWRRLESEVLIEQEDGERPAPLNAMILPLRGQKWPDGRVQLRSLPW